MDRRAFLAAGTAVVATLSGCGQVGGNSRSEFDVDMSATSFLPRQYETRVGEPVVWGNSSSRPHTVTADSADMPDGADYFASGGFDDERAARDGWRSGKGEIAPGETYEHTFRVNATYPYFCIPHERRSMEGKIVVRK